MDTDTKKALAALNAACEKIDNAAEVKVPSMSPGQGWAQGDVLVLRVEEIPAGFSLTPLPSDGQAVEGDTKGARHTIDATPGTVRFYTNLSEETARGAVEAAEPWALRHPEHADCVFEEGPYVLVHQINEHLRRVRD